MRRFFSIALIVVATSLIVASQTKSNDAPKEEFDEGVHAYRAGRFAEAQQHFEQAVALDPNQKIAILFVARAIHAQYRPSVETPENIATAHKAIAAYQRVPPDEPLYDEAYKAVASLYGALKDDVQQRAWIMQRTNDENISAEKRSDAYTVLTSKEWHCSYTITEQRENKATIDKDGAVIVRFVKPKSANEFRRAQQCALNGLNLVEQALSLNPRNESAWSYKTHLLREMAKLAEMDGQIEQKADYTAQADEAQQHFTVLSEQQKKLRQASGTASP